MLGAKPLKAYVNLQVTVSVIGVKRRHARRPP